MPSTISNNRGICVLWPQPDQQKEVHTCAGRSTLYHTCYGLETAQPSCASGPPLNMPVIDVDACIEKERVCASVGLMPTSISNRRIKTAPICVRRKARLRNGWRYAKCDRAPLLYVHWAASCPRSCAAIQFPSEGYVPHHTNAKGPDPRRDGPRSRAPTRRSRGTSREERRPATNTRRICVKGGGGEIRNAITKPDNFLAAIQYVKPALL